MKMLRDNVQNNLKKIKAQEDLQSILLICEMSYLPLCMNQRTINVKHEIDSITIVTPKNQLWKVTLASL